jgi:hypothetical protein
LANSPHIKRTFTGKTLTASFTLIITAAHKLTFFIHNGTIRIGPEVLSLALKNILKRKFLKCQLKISSTIKIILAIIIKDVLAKFYSA